MNYLVVYANNNQEKAHPILLTNSGEDAINLARDPKALEALGYEPSWAVVTVTRILTNQLYPAGSFPKRENKYQLPERSPAIFTASYGSSGLMEEYWHQSSDWFGQPEKRKDFEVPEFLLAGRNLDRG